MLSPNSSVFINEFHYDNTGNDSGEFVEIAAPLGTNLSEYSIVLYNGSGGASYDTDSFAGLTLTDVGNGFGVVRINYPANGIQNGSPDGIALVRTVNGVTTVIEFLSYEGAFAATSGPASGITSTDVGVLEAGTEAVDSSSIHRVGTGNKAGDFTFAKAENNADSPGAANTGQTFTSLTTEPTVSVAATPGDTGATTATEGGAGAEGQVSYRFTRSGDSTGAPALNVTYTITGQAGASDFTNATGTVTIPAGQAFIDLVLNVNDDNLVEGTETFTVTVTDAAAYNPGSPSTATGTLTDNEPPPPSEPTVSVAATPGDAGATTATEGGAAAEGAVSYRFTRSGDSTGAPALDVTYTITGQAGTADFTNASGTVTIPAGQAFVDLVLNVNDDNLVEGTETFTVTVTDAANYAPGAPATANGSITDNEAAPTITRIFDIQGAGHTSALAGQQVTIEGIVTARDTNGFYVQEAVGDGNINTSDGIFIFTNTAPPASAGIGDTVRVSGTVEEFRPGGNDAPQGLTITELSGMITVTQLVDGTAANLPAAVVLGPGGRLPITENVGDDSDAYRPGSEGIDFYESLEGMLVTVKNPLVVSPAEQPSGQGLRFFTVVDSDTDPANGFNATGLSLRNTINIKGGASSYGNTNTVGGDFNPERIEISRDTGVSGNAAFPTNVLPGARLNDVTGVVSYGFGNYEVLPTGAVTVAAASTIAREATTLTGGADRITVASYNVENLDANDAQARFDLAASDIVNNLGMPDIVVLQEIQDNDGVTGGTGSTVTAANQTLQELVDAINALTPGDTVTYAFIDNRFIGDDTNGGQQGGNIRNAFIYRTDRVEFIPGSDRTIDANGAATTAVASNTSGPFAGSRIPLVADFTFLPTGEEITVIGNHFASKIGSDPLFGTRKPPFNSDEIQRAEQAQAVNTFVDGLLAANANAQIVVAGDLNEFSFEEPLSVLKGTGSLQNGSFVAGGDEVLNDLMLSLAEDERYSYIFEGNSQDLDHILVSDSLFDLAEFDAVHINSEFLAANRLSEHDPILARLFLPAANDTMAGGAGGDVIRGGGGADSINGGGGSDTINGGSGEDTLDGGEGDDRIDGSRDNDTLNGGEGADTLEGGPGDDSLTGGSGQDWASYTTAGAGITLNLGVSAAQATGGAGSDTVREIENVIGSNFNDAVTGDGGANIILGLSGADTVGGGVGADTVFGNKGADILNGGDGADLMFGGMEDDRLSGGNDADGMLGDFGNDMLLGELGDDILSGGEGADTVLGGEGRDFVFGGPGSDTVDGGIGDDFTAGDEGADVITNSGGRDTLFGGDSNDTITAGDSGDTIFGSQGLDQITGGSGADIIFGGQDADTVSAGGGADRIDGDMGGDNLRGGADADVFVLETGDSFSSDAAGVGVDRIFDFILADGDRLDFAGPAATVDGSGVDGTYFESATDAADYAAALAAAQAHFAGTSGATANDLYFAVRVTGENALFVFFDAESDGAVEAAAGLTGVALNAFDSTALI